MSFKVIKTQFKNVKKRQMQTGKKKSQTKKLEIQYGENSQIFLIILKENICKNKAETKSN